MPDTQAIQAHWKTTLVILTLSAVLMSLSYTMLIPFLPMYLIEELGVEQSRANFWSGLVFSVSFLISGVMAPIWGAMADKRSRKLMALRAAILLAVSYALGLSLIHIFYMNEAVSSPEACRDLVRRTLTRFRLPYITVTPTFSICPKHGYLSGRHDFCPKCDAELLAKKRAKAAREEAS